MAWAHDTKAWECGDLHHQGPKDVLDRNCGGCRMRRLVLADRRDRECICPVLRPTPGGCPVHGG